MKKEIYWKVNYRDSIDNEYVENPNQMIRAIHITLLDAEFNCLKEHNFNVVEFNFEFGYAVIREEIGQFEDINKTYKNKNLVPYIQLRPSMKLCDIEGNIINERVQVC